MRLKSTRLFFEMSIEVNPAGQVNHQGQRIGQRCVDVSDDSARVYRRRGGFQESLSVTKWLLVGCCRGRLNPGGVAPDVVAAISHPAEALLAPLDAPRVLDQPRLA